MQNLRKLMIYMVMGLYVLPLCWAGNDTTSFFPRTQSLEEVVAVGARFSHLPLEKLPYEIKAFSQTAIRNSASIGLTEFLREQANIFVGGNPGSLLGAEMQMMGLNSSYIQIVEDGQPLIGREGGTLNTQRIPSFFIRKLEIIKGAMSTVYGDNAMAGIISIVTLPTDQNKWEGEISMNSLGKFSADLGANFKLDTHHKFNVSLSYEGFKGYDNNPNAIGNAIDPYVSLGGRVHWVTDWGKHTFRIVGRGYINKIEGPHAYGSSWSDVGFNQSEVKDYNLSAEWRYKIKDNMELRASLGNATYSSWFAITNQENNPTTYISNSSQTLVGWRPSVVLRYKNIAGGLLAIGSDIDLQTLNSDRYQSEKQRNNFAVYAQQEWNSKHWTIIGSLRLDAPNSFDAQLSPKIGAQYAIGKWRFNASLGAGYRSPDLRQQFMFFNHSDLGYYVVGGNVIRDILKNTFNARQSFVDSISINPLIAERSQSYQLGISYRSNKKHNFSIWIFRNNIQNMINRYTLNSGELGTTKSIYSYKNISQAYTQGVDIDYSYQISPKLKLSLMYGFVQAREPDVEDAIARGEVIARPANGQPYRVKPEEYRGVFLVPNHLLNVGISGELKRLFFYQINFRVQSEMGTLDKNGSSYFDSPSELAPEVYNLDIGLRKEFSLLFPHGWGWQKANLISVHVGAKNILNQVIVSDNVPTIMGINFYIKCSISIL